MCEETTGYIVCVCVWCGVVTGYEMSHRFPLKSNSTAATELAENSYVSSGCEGFNDFRGDL